MKIINTKFAGLKVIQNFTFLDKRGYFKELIVEKKIKKKFPFNVMSFSKKIVLRGMHLQTKKSQGKYISVIKGEILDVVVDLRKNSKTFRKQFITRLGEKNSKSIFIPDFPIAIITLPQFGSSPAIAVLTRFEFAIEKAIFFASSSFLELITIIVINLVGSDQW